MKNKHILYHILIAYIIICSVFIIIFCINMCNLGIEHFKYITAIVIIKQIFEILTCVFFFYKNLINFSLIKNFLSFIIYMHFFFLGADFATKIFNKTQSSFLVLFIELIFIAYLIFLKRMREKEVSHDSVQ